MKKKKGDYEPSEQDMKDAWIIWYSVKSLVKNTLEELEDIGEMFKAFETGLRVMLDRPIAEGSPGDQIMKRLYYSWEQKSRWVDDENKKMKKGEIDIYGAYSQAVIQTVFATAPTDEEKEKFYDERKKDAEELQKRIREWNKAIDNQERELNY